jgi:diaminopimelate epimerase
MRLSYFCFVKGKFYKYQGTGNDFVVLDGRDWNVQWTTEQVQKICSRKWGVGSDGLIIVKPHTEWDFEMIFFNPDGSQSFCGNGSRVAVRFFMDHFSPKNEFAFLAIDGQHTAVANGNDIKVKMSNVAGGSIWETGCFLNTGSPHVVLPVEHLNDINLIEEGRRVRYHQDFKQGNGSNVNFISQQGDVVNVRTYERGVEDETLSCGTGVTAAGLYVLESLRKSGTVKVHTRGGELEVAADRLGVYQFENVYLKGGAEFVFEGIWEV